MPIAIPYTLEEVDGVVCVRVATRDVKPVPEVVVTRTHIRVHQPPALQFVDFVTDVHFKDAAITLQADGSLVITVPVAGGGGGRGDESSATSRAALAARREAGMEEWFAWQRQVSGDKREAAAALERAALRDQMAMEASAVKRLDDAKARAKAEAAADVFATFAGMAKGGADGDARQGAWNVDAGRGARADSSIFDHPTPSPATPPAAAPHGVAGDGHGRAHDVVEADDLPTRACAPPPRGGGGDALASPMDGPAAGAATAQVPGHKVVVPLSFTPRVLPTPLRESKVAEENEWMARNLARQAASGRAPSTGAGGPAPRAAIMQFTSQVVRLFQNKDFHSCLTALHTLQATAPDLTTAVPLLHALQVYCLLKTGAPASTVDAVVASGRDGVATSSLSSPATVMSLVMVAGGRAPPSPSASSTGEAAPTVLDKVMQHAREHGDTPPTPLVAALVDVAMAVDAANQDKANGNVAVQQGRPRDALRHYHAALHAPHPSTTPPVLLNASRAYLDTDAPAAALQCVRRADALITMLTNASTAYPGAAITAHRAGGVHGLPLLRCREDSVGAWQRQVTARMAILNTAVAGATGPIPTPAAAAST